MNHLKWRVLRRIGAVGLLWNRASDAWLNILGLKAAQRHEIFRELVEEGHIVAVTVEQVKDSLYCLADDESFIGRVEVIAERKTKTLIIKNIWYEEDVK